MSEAVFTLALLEKEAADRTRVSRRRCSILHTTAQALILLNMLNYRMSPTPKPLQMKVMNLGRSSAVYIMDYKTSLPRHLWL